MIGSDGGGGGGGMGRLETLLTDDARIAFTRSSHALCSAGCSHDDSLPLPLCCHYIRKKYINKDERKRTEKDGRLVSYQ